MTADQFKAASDWMAPDDSSQNRLEVAAATEPGVLLIRDTFDQRQISCTNRQLMALANAVQNGHLQSLTGR